MDQLSCVDRWQLVSIYEKVESYRYAPVELAACNFPTLWLIGLVHVNFNLNPCIDDGAGTPEVIPALIRNLRAYCPPDECSAQCSELISGVEIKADNVATVLRGRIHELEDNLLQVEEKILQVNATFEERIAILEGIVLYNISISNVV